MTAHERPDIAQTLARLGSTPANPNPAEIERSIQLVQGVQAARVQFDGKSIAKLHALVDGDRDTKQIVRDIESILYVLFRITLDYRKISLVHVQRSEPLGHLARVRISSCQLDVGPPARVWVSLQHDDHEVSGEATVEAEVAAPFLASQQQIETLDRRHPADDRLREQLDALLRSVAERVEPHLAASATLRAVGALVDDPLAVAVVGVAVQPVGGRPVVTVEVEATGELAGARATGFALVLEPARRGEAACRATLDALQRLAEAM